MWRFDWLAIRSSGCETDSRSPDLNSAEELFVTQLKDLVLIRLNYDARFNLSVISLFGQEGNVDMQKHMRVQPEDKRKFKKYKW